MIDTHCHLDLDAFAEDRDAVLVRAAAAGVIGILVPAIRPRTWDALVAFGHRDAARGVRIALGIHPQIVPELDATERDGDRTARIAAVVEASGAVAIGECGLDSGTADHALQEAIFADHIRAARAVKRPLVIHVLRAHDAALRILRAERAGDVGGVLHSYSGGAALVPVYAALGLAFSFAGPIAYANARRPIEAARVVPEDALLVETDAPDQSPIQGSRHEPAHLAAVVAALAAARGSTPAAIAALTTANARSRFATW